jgi:hypothetical protein
MGAAIGGGGGGELSRVLVPVEMLLDNLVQIHGWV